MDLTKFDMRINIVEIWFGTANGKISRTPEYTLYSGVHVCWSEHSDLSFFYVFMNLDYGLGTMTATTFYTIFCPRHNRTSVF